jgi:CDP-glucose 4,6-dehydratase
VEGVVMSFWAGRRVVVTGHTGFKGSWLSLWLQQLNAYVCGVALDPPTDPSMFIEAGVAQGMRSEIADIRDLDQVKAAFREHRPEVVFHMAAQPLVRKSYEDPVATYATNVMGTVNVLEAIRGCNSVRAVVVITTDKCYENKEWVWPYRETDRLGGYDPYSNSKACSELVVSAFRNSFFNPADYGRHGVAVASVRAGNVIGGGDWAEDRLVPDIMRAFTEKSAVRIRSPRAIRPWQHVLEPLRGYLTVAESLCEQGIACGEAWNFGPDQSDVQPVEWVVRELAKTWGAGARWELEEGVQPHEAQSLMLDCSNATTRLGWRPRIRLTHALAMTSSWYQARLQQRDMHAYTIGQILDYIELPQIGASGN